MLINMEGAYAFGTFVREQGHPCRDDHMCQIDLENEYRSYLMLGSNGLFRL